MTSTVTVLRSSAKIKTVEHAGSGKPKTGLRRLLSSKSVVVSHYAALRNCLRSRSFDFVDVSLAVFVDLCYSDDIFSVFPPNTETRCVLMFREFPYESDICSLESVL